MVSARGCILLFCQPEFVVCVADIGLLVQLLMEIQKAITLFISSGISLMLM